MHYFQTMFIQTSSSRKARCWAFKTRPEVLNKSLIVWLTCWKPFKPLKPITADCLEQDWRTDDSEQFKRTQCCCLWPSVRYCSNAPSRTHALRAFGCDLTALCRRFVGLMCRGNLSFLSSSGCGGKKIMFESRELWKEKEGTEWVTEREKEKLSYSRVDMIGCGWVRKKTLQGVLLLENNQWQGGVMWPSVRLSYCCCFPITAHQCSVPLPQLTVNTT